METESKNMQADCIGSYPNVFFFLFLMASPRRSRIQ